MNTRPFFSPFRIIREKNNGLGTRLITEQLELLGIGAENSSTIFRPSQLQALDLKAHM